MHVTSVHAVEMLKYIDADEDLRRSLHTSENPRDLFVSSFREKLMEKQQTSKLFSLKCTSGHKMDCCIDRVAFTMFNIRAKNYIAERNDIIHQNNKKEYKIWSKT